MATAVATGSRSPRGLPKILRSPTTARILFPFVVLGIWYFIYYTLDSRIFPSPQQVAVFMWEEITLTSGVRYSSVAENLYVQFGISLMRLTIGFVIALIVGTIIGLAMGVSKKVDAFFHDWVMGLLAMPALVYALFLGLALGFTNLGPIIAVVLAGAPFVIINIREGVRNTPKELIDMARSFEVPQNKVTRHVLLPSLMPFFFAAIRYAYAIGWKGLVITEVFASDRGMGWTIKFWYDAHRAHGVIGYAIFFIIFALALEKLVFDPLAERAFKWRPKIDAVQMAEGDFGGVQREGFLFIEDQEIDERERTASMESESHDG
ncbi:MAG TPA: ABC transporter permease [Acidimicrobiia bacterium]|nr:ABC transporter permease [Acidimicrobiia bacterium]HEX5671299.1 ABC transporter permease [Acidimicrobiia bacterium]